ncbi:MAG: ATP-binding cassette domain-containing protein [Pseudomonadota bacterium]
MPTIEVRELTRNYGSFVAVDRISFQVQRGEIVGFLGPNAAGKTTTMKVLTGYLAPTAGQALVDGIDVLDDPIAVRNRIGYLPESAPVYRDMRVVDYLDFVARVRGLARAERAAAVRRVAEQCGLGERLLQGIGSLSKGFRQRVGLAQALVHSPEILILDEPTSGLDPNQIVEIRNLIREIGRHKTVILSTHILSEVQATCDRVVIIHQGRIVADGTTEDIMARQRGGQLVQAVFAPGKVRLPAPVVRAAVEAIPGVQRVAMVEVGEPGAVGLQVIAERDVRADLFQLAAEKGLLLLELHRETSSLEEVFQRVTTGLGEVGALGDEDAETEAVG